MKRVKNYEFSFNEQVIVVDERSFFFGEIGNVYDYIGGNYDVVFVTNNGFHKIERLRPIDIESIQ
jgi:hypothetical protein